MKMLFIILLFTILQMHVSGQSIISGIVSTAEGNLPGANVYLEATYDGVSTNANGEFSFKTQKKGRMMLKASFIGFETFAKEIDLDGTPIHLEIRLTEAFNKLEAVMKNYKNK